MEHDGCKGCKYEHESPDSKHCLGCKQNAIDKYAPMTNADRIRSMTDKELAEFISSLVRNADDYLTSEGNWLIWLQSEAE